VTQLKCFNPLEVTERIRKIVTRVENGRELRKYYRFRASRFYGGSAVADAVGCNLRCAFCWSWRVNTAPELYGEFYNGEQVGSRLLAIARRHGLRVMRVSGGEPTISMDHLIELLEAIDRKCSSAGMLFVLETNGIVIGSDEAQARRLASFSSLHVRVSIKACSPREFQRVTGACSEFFELQLKALKNLVKHGVSVHPALVVSFCEKDALRALIQRIREIDEDLVRELEEEVVILYPSVKKRLEKLGLRPRHSYEV